MVSHRSNKIDVPPLIELPASTHPSRDAFLYQSDLGDGVTRQLRFEDWMAQKASHPISLDDINTLFTNMAQNQIDLAHIAKLFDIDENVKMLRAERLILHKIGQFDFQFAEYDLKNLENNMSIIKASCG
ncbi:TPA: cycle-inhibiting factor [Yersinia enterocolitica]|nr:cycle-inhibiting factor [Yersinia enterocolitica]